MSTTTWVAKKKGVVKPAATKLNPGLVVLSAPGRIFEQFDCSIDLPVGPITFSAKSRSYFAFYVEVSTNKGRRQFKFVPTDQLTPVRKFRYRYEVGVGKSVRNGNLQARVVDLQALASKVERGITIESVGKIFVRVAGEMHIEVVDTSSVTTPVASKRASKNLKKQTSNEMLKQIETQTEQPQREIVVNRRKTSTAATSSGFTSAAAASTAAACLTASCSGDSPTSGSGQSGVADATGQAVAEDSTISSDGASVETESGTEATVAPVTPRDGEITVVEAVRFLTQATFGANLASIQELQAMGSYADWIDAQLDQPASTTLEWVKANSNGSNSTMRHKIWTTNVLTGPDQLRQRVAFALSELFVISDLDYTLSNSQYAVSQFYDILTEDAFGSYRELLERVTLHSSMGVYLSHIRNEKADPARNVRPDENYAREVLQLFSIGLYELAEDGRPRLQDGNPIPAFGLNEVENFAKVFTGWSYAGTNWTDNNGGRFDKESPMVAFEEFHDTSEKVLLNGTVLPAGQTAQQDLTGALDNIFAHQNVGPFIATHLIQRLVTSNPTPEYVSRVAATFADNGKGERGDLGAVVKAILLDPEARTGHITMPETFGKIREPLLRFLQTVRTFNVQAGAGAEAGEIRPRARPMDAIDNVVGQAVMQARHVFNFFLPSTPLKAGSDMVAPELEILTEINVASTNNMLFSQIYDFNHLGSGSDQYARIQMQREVELANDVDALLEHLNIMMTGGAVPAEALSVIGDHVRSVPLDEEEGQLNRALDATFLIAASPFHLVQK